MHACYIEYCYFIVDKVTIERVNHFSSTGKPAIYVRWSTPTSDDPITIYDIDFRIVGSPWDYYEARANSISREFRSLLVGTTYQIRIRAVYTNRNGAWSDIVNITTPGGKGIVYMLTVAMFIVKNK